MRREGRRACGKGCMTFYRHAHGDMHTLTSAPLGPGGPVSPISPAAPCAWMKSVQHHGAWHIYKYTIFSPNHAFTYSITCNSCLSHVWTWIICSTVQGTWKEHVLSLTHTEWKSFLLKKMADICGEPRQHFHRQIDLMCGEFSLYNFVSTAPSLNYVDMILLLWYCQLHAVCCYDTVNCTVLLWYCQLQCIAMILSTALCCYDTVNCTGLLCYCQLFYNRTGLLWYCQLFYNCTGLLWYYHDTIDYTVLLALRSLRYQTTGHYPVTPMWRTTGPGGPAAPSSPESPCKYRVAQPMKHAKGRGGTYMASHRQTIQSN